MKIEGEHPLARTGQPDPADRTERTAHPPSNSAAGPTGAAHSDQIQLSPDLQLVRTAVEAAVQSPVVRSETVDRMRALLAQGRLGANATQLADAIIENWLITS